ncbi:MAG: hypothetical protein ACHP93_00785 [Solirubrobacterales bacterium]
MLTSRRLSRPLCGLILLSLSWLASPAVAETSPPPGGPAEVTVRVLGAAPTFPTLLGLTAVATTTAPVVKDGGSCSGTSAAGALELATKGNWEGHWNSGFGDYEVLSIDGQAYPFEPGSSKNYFWSLWLNGKEASTGVCGAQLQAGEQVLFFPGCFGSECPPAPNVLGVEVPTVAEVAAPVPVTVVSHPSAGGEPVPAAGASVASEGTSGKTDAGGHVTLTFSHAGSYTLHVTGAAEGPPSVPAEAAVCVHAGNDGTCGTTAPSASPGAPGAAGGGTLGARTSVGPNAIVADLTGLIDSHRYGRGDAPRVLAGKVTADTSVASISLRLRRTYRGRCWTYDGKRERFLRVRCRQGSFFRVAPAGDSFSYLLPSRLPAGRYVLDIRATDAAGDHTALLRGTSRIVFYVA